jgi:hypothetical protein
MGTEKSALRSEFRREPQDQACVTASIALPQAWRFSSFLQQAGFNRPFE